MTFVFFFRKTNSIDRLMHYFQFCSQTCFSWNYNGWAIKNVTFCILTISHSFFILMNLIFFSKYSQLKALQNTLFLLSKIISIILRYVIQSIRPRRTTFKDNLLTNLSNRSFHLDDESFFRRDLIPINSMSKFIPD